MKYTECLRCGKMSPRWSVVGNISMCIFKFIVGMLAGSKGLIADSLHSVADAISSLFVLIALHFSGKPKDNKRPFGYGKVEYISTIIASLFIFLCAVTVMFDSLESIKSGMHRIPGISAIFATLLSMVFSMLMYSSNTCAGTQLNSPAMLADAAESKADVLTSLAVLIGLIGTKIGYRSADNVAAIVVAIFIFRIGAEMFLSGVHGLIDVSMDPEALEQIRKICLNVSGVDGVKNIKSRRMGQKSQVNIDIEVAKSKTVLETHEVVKRLKTAIENNIEGVDNIFVRAIPVQNINFLRRN
jgi:cation diffusion facilitator family transporter